MGIYPMGHFLGDHSHHCGNGTREAMTTMKLQISSVLFSTTKMKKMKILKEKKKLGIFCKLATPMFLALLILPALHRLKV
jgi:hypothetical protein